VAEPQWLDLDVILDMHRRNLIRYGGGSGLRDQGLLESALARPKWLHEYDTGADLHRLAAAYAFGIVKNHPFIDGNKRLGFVSAYTFLRFNGWYVTADERDTLRALLALASGNLTEAEFAAWLKQNSEATPTV
jgi:death on curing protein